MGEFDGKVAFITGAARGQGRSHAVALAKAGASVALLDIANGECTHPPARVATRDDLDETLRLVESAGGRGLALPCDVRSEDGMRDAVDRAVEYFGGLDFVISNAGILAKFQYSWDIPVEDWRASIDTNLTGQWLTLKYTIPHLIERGRGSSIIIVSSTAGVTPLPFGTDYCSAKHALVGLGKSLANELGPFGVRVNVLLPGLHESGMIAAAAEANGIDPDALIAQLEDHDLLGAGVMRPEEGTTPAVMWLLSDNAKWVHGSIQCVDAGETAKAWTPG